MRDCGKCPDRAELHPEYLDAETGDIPCFACEERDGTHEDALDAAHVEYNDERLREYAAHTRLTILAEILAKWDTLSDGEKQVVRIKFENPCANYVQMALELGVSDRTCSNRLKKAYAKIPTLRL